MDINKPSVSLVNDEDSDNSVDQENIKKHFTTAMKRKKMRIESKILEDSDEEYDSQGNN